MWGHSEVHTCGDTVRYIHVGTQGGTYMWGHREVHTCGDTVRCIHVSVRTQ